eukprot:140517_1
MDIKIMIELNKNNDLHEGNVLSPKPESESKLESKPKQKAKPKPTKSVTKNVKHFKNKLVTKNNSDEEDSDLEILKVKKMTIGNNNKKKKIIKYSKNRRKKKNFG